MLFRSHAAALTAEPVRFKNFLAWWDAVPLNPDLRARKLFNDLERQVAIDDAARQYDLSGDE